jgi:adenosylhomocysteine nucleosidase
MTENPSVVILTALDVEYDEVYAALSHVRSQVHPAGTRFDIGHVNADGPLVALTLTGKGNLPAGTLTERAITYFSPVAVLFVGVAGARRGDVALGDVVVATHVYAYHGATSEDDGTWARPRVWETAHSVDQTARHIARDRAWARRLPADPSSPQVHFGPIAAGEQVHYSKISPNATWLHEHYNDAIAVEMEAAGVAQASHLNDSLPMAVVRGISDSADATKVDADRAGWQRRAAASAAAFALALAVELSARPPRQSKESNDPPQPAPPATVSNSASGNARVGAQAGQIFGGVRNSFEDSPQGGDVLALLADLRAQLDQACYAGRVEEEVGQAAMEEVDAAADAARQQQGSRLRIAVRRLSGLIGDLAEFAGKLAAIVTAARSMS